MLAVKGHLHYLDPQFLLTQPFELVQTAPKELSIPTPVLSPNHQVLPQRLRLKVRKGNFGEESLLRGSWVGLEVGFAELGSFLVNFDFVDEHFGLAVVDIVFRKERKAPLRDFQWNV